MLNIKCIVCNKINCVRYFNEQAKILECSECKAIYSEQQIDSKTIHFQEDLNIPTLSEKIKNKLTHERFWKLLSDEYMNYLKSKTNMNFKTALDVGTYFGSFVYELNKIGIDAYGIESNEKYVRLSVSNKVECGYFDENYKPKMKYDLICLTQMLYYMRNNYSILEHTQKMLSDDGLIFIATTNPESPYLRNKLKLVFEGPGTNMVLSKYNFKSLEKKMGLKLLDYTTYRTDLFFDLYDAKNKKLNMIKYFLKLKKAYVSDPNGNHAFLLLKNI